jgi:hypothetical protein
MQGSVKLWIVDVDPEGFGHFAAVISNVSINRIFKSIRKRGVKNLVGMFRQINAKVTPGLWGVVIAAGGNQQEKRKEW